MTPYLPSELHNKTLQCAHQKQNKTNQLCSTNPEREAGPPSRAHGGVRTPLCAARARGRTTLETAQSDEAKEMARHEGASTYLPFLPASLLPLTWAVPYLSPSAAKIQ